MGSLVSHSLTHLVADLTDVTLADEDNNRAIMGNVGMQMTSPGGQTCE